MASFTNGVGQDTPFDLSFNGTFELFRPFLSNPNAPVSNVGIYAADACNWFGSGCAMAPDALLSFNALEASGTATTITKGQVSVIANGGEAQQIFGTPFGNVARNSFRDAKTNSANITPATYRPLVKAPESCQVAITPPGKPHNPNEPDLDVWTKRADPSL